MAVETAAGFVVLPYLVRNLGDTTYGLWILIASLTDYFGLLDLGVRGSAGRHIAFFTAKNDTRSVNGILNTALAFLSAAAVLVILGTFGIQAFFSTVFENVPQDLVHDVRIALIIVGLNLAMTLLWSVFDATLWALQRFDLLNAIDIPFVILRVALIFTFVAGGHDLVTLALITAVITSGRGLAKMGACFLVAPSLRLNRGDVSLTAFRQLFDYGLWNFLLSVSRLVVNRIGPILITIRLAVALVTPYNIAARLIGYASAILISATGVLTPLAASFHADENQDRQRALFLEGGKYCASLAVFFLTLFLLLGKPLLRLWIGPACDDVFPLLVIMAVGEALPMAQWVTHSMILGMGRHSWSALFGIAEISAAIPLAFMLMDDHKLAGLCLAFAVPGAIFRGLIPMCYGCHLVQVSLWHYLTRSLLLPLMAGGLSALGLGLLVSWQVPETWLQLVSYTAAYGIGFLGLTCCFFFAASVRSFFPRRSRNTPLPEKVIYNPGRDGAEVCRSWHSS
jgi:O-antigen/teichoic acid export membrane protein